MDKSTDAWVAMELSGADAHSPRKNSDDVQMALAFSGRLPNVNSQAAPKVSDHAVTNTVDAHSEFTVDGDSDVTECRASTLGTSRSKSSQRGWLTRRWWASKAHALSKSPVGVAAILVLMCLMIGLGVWGVIAGSNQAANREREAAFIVASEKAMNLKNVFNAAYGPALAVATMIRNNPLNLTSLSAQFEGAVADAMARQTELVNSFQVTYM
ncbi:hypothetical protein FOA52_007101 [Chlamydomonas sp. UWO 241]|nr:hypothetical protein FOA52_007101 [Chlamydomonas sp. UWO 241]